MKPPLVFCLHGFLGQPSDWSFLTEDEQEIYEFVFVDYTREPHLNPHQPLAHWGENFNSYVRSFGEERVRHLVGYSLGGRLALHAIQNDPTLWTKAAFISTHFGLKAAELKNQRIKSDTLFAKKIERAKWEQVLVDWNSQFQDQQKEPPRPENKFERKVLAAALKNWSLGFQYDFRENLLNWPVQQLWVAGEQDPRYREILSSLPNADFVQKQLIPESSHRVLFEQPSLLKQTLTGFLD